MRHSPCSRHNTECTPAHLMFTNTQWGCFWCGFHSTGGETEAQPGPLSGACFLIGTQVCSPELVTLNVSRRPPVLTGTGCLREKSWREQRRTGHGRELGLLIGRSPRRRRDLALGTGLAKGSAGDDLPVPAQPWAHLITFVRVESGTF